MTASPQRADGAAPTFPRLSTERTPTPGVSAVGVGGADARPLVAIVANVLTPYRLHAHRRIAREIPEIRLATLFTHDQADQAWDQRAPEEIGPVQFGRGLSNKPMPTRARIRYELDRGTAVVDWIREHDAKAVLVGGYNDLSRMRILRWCRSSGMPCFLYADSNVYDDTATGLKRLIKSAYVGHIVRGLTGVMPCGRLGARYFERYGARPDRTFFFPYEPDYDLIFSQPTEAIAAVATELGFTSARRRMVMCCRLIEMKGVDFALEAFARIADERPEWDLVIIGDGPLRQSLESSVPERLRSRVRWLGFIGDQARISAIYRRCDLLVHPSRFEPWAVVINEAAAAGLAIVASHVVGAANELVRDDLNGFLFPTKNVDALTDALRRASEPGTIDRLKRGSAQTLADWRRTGDPVEGLRKALRSVGVFKS
jgi:glycosyltransferase involved in cell wall biosynthesis